MRIKTDFVTNSSSSAFIVFWPYKITSIKDVKRYIKRSDFASHIYSDSGGGFLVKKDDKNIINIIASELRAGWVDGIYDPNFTEDFMRRNGITREEFYENSVWQTQANQEETKMWDIKSLIMAIQLIEENEGKYAYLYEYGDEDGGIFEKLEHNNDWGGLSFVRISKH